MRLINQVLLGLICSLGYCSPILGQRTLMDEPVQLPSERIQKGPNTRYYQSGYWSFGMAVSIDESDSAKTSASTVWRYGTRGKWKWSNTFSGIWDLAWNRSAYRIKQDVDQNLFGDGEAYAQQKFVWNQLELGAALRTNIGKRGNYLGNYFDLGAYGEWAFSINQQIKINADPTTNKGAKSIKAIFGELDYVNPLNYGLTARIGVNKVALWSKYRLSNLFKASESVNGGRPFPELTRLQIGVEVTF